MAMSSKLRLQRTGPNGGPSPRRRYVETGEAMCWLPWKVRAIGIGILSAAQSAAWLVLDITLANHHKEKLRDPSERNEESVVPLIYLINMAVSLFALFTDLMLVTVSCNKQAWIVLMWFIFCSVRAPYIIVISLWSMNTLHVFPPHYAGVYMIWAGFLLLLGLIHSFILWHDVKDIEKESPESLRSDSDLIDIERPFPLLDSVSGDEGKGEVEMAAAGTVSTVK